MAIYHLSAQVFSRGYGHSAVHAAAYRARDDLTDERTGLRHDYSRKADELLFEGIYAPKDAPEWAHDRAQLWNHVEAFEKHRRAELAREFNIALPCELTPEQNRYALQDWIRDNFTRKGLIADAVIHAPSEQGDERNLHAHVMVVMRKLDGSEFARTKERFDTYSEKEAAKVAELEGLRESWARIGNRHLERHGFEASLDHRTLEAQGIERDPTIHMGKSATAIERDGNASELGGVNREIAAENERKIIDLAAERVMREARAAARGQVDDIRAQDAGADRDAAAEEEARQELYRQYVPGYDPPQQPAAEAAQARETSAAPSAPGQENTHATARERAADEMFSREARPAAETPRVIHLGPPADDPRLRGDDHAAEPTAEKTTGITTGLAAMIEAAAERLGAFISYLGDFFSPPPPPTKEQVKQQERAAEEQRQQEPAAREKAEEEARFREILEQIRRDDARARQARERGIERDDDYGRERERER